MRNISEIQRKLQTIGLNKDEAVIFISLVDSPKTQLELSRSTGIARSNVYRVVDGMTSKGLLFELATESGKVLTSCKLDALELLVIEQETIAESRRNNLDKLLPLLTSFQNPDKDFSIKSYSGLAGVKQMLWNELRTKGEVLIFSGATLDLTTGKRWAEKYRLEIIQRKIKQRGIENIGVNPNILSDYRDYTDYYKARYIPEEILNIQPEITIHDDTISIYNSLAHDVQIGAEITNPFLATFMRQIFEHYWLLASENNK